ncbi:MAG: hypothetical protein ACRDF7_03355 [Candidatus Limnocylindrales bacterium]
MSATRRPASIGAIALMVITVAGCGPEPNVTSPDSTRASASPSATALVTTAPTPSPSATGSYPLLIVRVEDADGLHWYATLPDDPSRRHAIAAPLGAVEMGPAAPDGTVPLTVGSTLLLATLHGADLTVERTVDMAAVGVGPGAPACIGPGPSVAVADTETLALTIVPVTGAAVPVAAQDALGECAWLADGRLLLSREGDRLAVADDVTGTIRAVAGGSGRYPSTGGGLLALVDRSGSALGAARVVVRSGALTGTARSGLGAPRFTIEPGPNELISRASLSPDGAWLAVEVVLDPDGAGQRTLRLYGIVGGGAQLAREVALGPGEQVIVLPAP